MTIFASGLRETEEGELGNEISRHRVVDRHGFTAKTEGKFPLINFQNRTEICICTLGLKRTEKIFNMGVSRPKVCQTLLVVAK